MHHEMSVLVEKCRNFIKDISTPIKKEHSRDIKVYLEKFIQFPGGLAIVSVFLPQQS